MLLMLSIKINKIKQNEYLMKYGRWKLYCRKQENAVDIYSIKPYDTSEIIKLKKKIKQAYKQQDDLVEKYKCVRS